MYRFAKLLLVWCFSISEERKSNNETFVYLFKYKKKRFLENLYKTFFGTDVNECDLFPCQNNGTCINSLGSYTCECETGWQGQDCHIGKSVVLVMLIMQGCYHMQRWYHALFILLLDVDECRSTPCANNGTCINNKGSYTCVCKRGWTDLNCDKGMDCNV